MKTQIISSDIIDYLNQYHFTQALESIWQSISQLEKQIDDQKPWTLSGDSLTSFLASAINTLLQVAANLDPFLPDTASAIRQIFSSQPILPPKPLFPRLPKPLC